MEDEGLFELSGPLATMGEIFQASRCRSTVVAPPPLDHLQLLSCSHHSFFGTETAIEPIRQTNQPPVEPGRRLLEVPSAWIKMPDHGANRVLPATQSIVPGPSSAPSPGSEAVKAAGLPFGHLPVESSPTRHCYHAGSNYASPRSLARSKTACPTQERVRLHPGKVDSSSVALETHPLPMAVMTPPETKMVMN